MTRNNDPTRLFQLRFPIGGKPCTITAWEGPFQRPNHTRIDVELRHGGATVFPKGATWCGIPAHQTIDGIDAKECVLALFAMKPGDTDAEFFETYTADQLAFVTAYGDEISSVREWRYCDPETGNVKRPKR